jgi:hypothetical protein
LEDKADFTKLDLSNNGISVEGRSGEKAVERNGGL